MGARKTLVLVLSVMAATAPGPLRAEKALAAPSLVRIGDAFTALAVRNALDGAARRLQQQSCQAVFAQFTDHQGRSLDQNLLDLGETAESYLAGRVLFYDAVGQGPCRRLGVLAYTQPGSRVVLVCGRAFEATWRNERRLAEAVLIHEMMHSLGLGENPPTSAEITTRVLEACRH
jgi:hypothetical protein